MTAPNISYEIISTKDLPNGNKIVFLNVIRKELPITNADGSITTPTYITSTSVLILPTENVEDIINAYIAQEPI